MSITEAGSVTWRAVSASGSITMDARPMRFQLRPEPAERVERTFVPTIYRCEACGARWTTGTEEVPDRCLRCEGDLVPEPEPDSANDAEQDAHADS